MDVRKGWIQSNIKFSLKIEKYLPFQSEQDYPKCDYLDGIHTVILVILAMVFQTQLVSDMGRSFDDTDSSYQILRYVKFRS
jgi:hypothetical protein